MTVGSDANSSWLFAPVSDHPFNEPCLLAIPFERLPYHNLKSRDATVRLNFDRKTKQGSAARDYDIPD